MVNSFVDFKVRINRNRNLDKLLRVRRSQKIVSRRMTYAVDQSFASMTNQLPQRQKKCLSKNTPFGRRNFVHAAIGYTQPVNNFARNDHVLVNGENDSIDTTANSHNNSDLDQRSFHAESDESHSTNDSVQTLAASDNIPVDVDSMGTLANLSDIAGDGFTSINSYSSCESMIQLISLGSDDELDHSMVATNNDSVITSILDGPIPTIANLTAPLIPKLPAILDEPILAKLPNPLKPSIRNTTQPIPFLIPIRDSPLFQNVHSGTKPGKKSTETAKHISKFLRDLEVENNHMVLPKSINIDYDVSVCSDENFGRLHYSDSE